jgi:hypothetical protein
MEKRALIYLLVWVLFSHTFGFIIKYYNINAKEGIIITSILISILLFI